MQKLIGSILLEEIQNQESSLIFDCFDNNTAWELGQLMSVKAEEKHLCITMNIRMNNDFTVFQRAMNNAKPNNTIWLEMKHNTVKIRNSSTLMLWTQLKVANKTMAQMKLSEDCFTDMGGGFPINVKGCGCLGSISVSGLTPIGDHNFIVECLNEFLHINIELIDEKKLEQID